MRKLVNKTNVDPADDDYPFGRARNNPGNRTGTPVDEDLVGDILQFFEKLFFESGLIANEMPDNDYTGFQLYEALETLFAKRNQGAWQDIPLINGWTAGARGAKYRVDQFGQCHLRGSLVASTASGDVITNGLPPPVELTYLYLPIPNIDGAALPGSGGPGNGITPMRITTDGAADFWIVALEGGGTKPCLDGLSYWTN